MFLNLQQKPINASLRFLQLGCQIAISFWFLCLDTYPCQQLYIQVPTYLSYILMAINLLLIIFKSQMNADKTIHYIVLVIDLVLVTAVFYFTVAGYHHDNNCAPTRLLYQLWFGEAVVAVVVVALIMFTKISWIQRYANWPGNVVWAILIFKFGISNIPALIIAFISAQITLTTLLIHWISSSSLNMHSNNKKLSAQWGLSMILMLASQILGIVVLATWKGGDGYWDQYLRKLFMAFLGVNAVDMVFWFYGYKKMKVLG